MTLRNEQIEAFANAMMRRYEKTMIGHLRTRFPEKLAAVEDEALRDRIRAGVDRGRHYGITAEPDLTRYLEYTVEYGPDFDVSPETQWAKPILTGTGLTGTAKMDRLDAFTTFELRP